MSQNEQKLAHLEFERRDSLCTAKANAAGEQDSNELQHTRQLYDLPQPMVCLNHCQPRLTTAKAERSEGRK